MFNLSFFGSSQEVTGSCFLLESKDTRMLIDCGLFQCAKFCDIKNEEAFEFDPKTIDFLVVTHAHIDHIGRIPKLMKEGFNGKIFSTPATRDFANIMLLDSVGVLGKEAKRHNKEVLYTEGDVEKAMKVWESAEYNEEFELKDFKVNLKDAGHILGSSIVEIWIEDKKIVFSGDLGNAVSPILKPMSLIDEADYLVTESLYGDKLHERAEERKDILEQSIEDTVTKGGTVIIPAFAIERTQEVLYELNELVENKRIPRIPVFLDSPMSIEATAIYKRYSQYYSKEAKDLIESGSYTKAREKGLMRTEGKSYIVKDGDIIEFKI